VLSQLDDKEALYCLGKDCKVLRYTLEASLAKAEESSVLRTLVSWQDILGAVRDGDVTTAHLERIERPTDFERILARERGRRIQDYERFVRACKKVSDAKIPL
jgi:CHAD domain-containing protein